LPVRRPAVPPTKAAEEFELTIVKRVNLIEAVAHDRPPVRGRIIKATLSVVVIVTTIAGRINVPLGNVGKRMPILPPAPANSQEQLAQGAQLSYISRT
jgi:hypothetical protein